MASGDAEGVLLPLVVRVTVGAAAPAVAFVGAALLAAGLVPEASSAAPPQAATHNRKMAAPVLLRAARHLAEAEASEGEQEKVFDSRPLRMISASIAVPKNEHFLLQARCAILQVCYSVTVIPGT